MFPEDENIIGKEVNSSLEVKKGCIFSRFFSVANVKHHESSFYSGDFSFISS